MGMHTTNLFKGKATKRVDNVLSFATPEVGATFSPAPGTDDKKKRDQETGIAGIPVIGPQVVKARVQMTPGGVGSPSAGTGPTPVPSKNAWDVGGIDLSLKP